ncbi:Ubiquitin carboxyl-terminal hydrolase 37 [Linnemannia exigua]|uniref:Ubiquitin carboxyl-terminal hydrolase 37 n=1 Tax=Linnemannia exigua TaxID=604196 RepID=A0AAD4DIL1_9FUNG|nr:Ubiquitin carboxyl-terminal hydrolase 37 [Linnemannia exigua]
MTSDTFVSTSTTSTSRPSSVEGDHNNHDHRPTYDIFNGIILVNDLERTSLSRKFENVQCWLACDDTASVNLYLDLQKELDHLEFKLTQNIRNVYFTTKTNIIKLHLNSKLRLDIILARVEHGQKLFDQLTRIKTRPGDSDDFPRHQPKIGIVKPDASSVYLTAKNDLPPDLTSFAVEAVEPLTSSRKRVIQHFIPSTDSERTMKKTRAVVPQDLFKTYRQSKEVVDPVLSTSPPVPQTTPERWRIPSSPACADAEIITPNRALVFDRFARIGYSAPHMPDPVPRPQFHAKVPTPRVLRSMNDRSKRYGREVDQKAAKGSGVLESRCGGSKCIYAVVQAILCLNPLVPDLTDSYLLLICGVQDGLFKSFTEAHATFSETGQLKIKEEEISNNIVKSSPGSLGGEVDDAREFLNDCLNQVRKEFSERDEYPITQMFGGKVDRISECANCGSITRISEKYQDLRLDVPTHDDSSNRSKYIFEIGVQDAVSIGSLVPQLFDAAPVECSKCHSDQATMHRTLSQLPEVLVLCLKRFSSNPAGGYNKHRTQVTIDATLEFTQFCSAEAFTHEAGPMAFYPEDFGMHPHIPSDSLPSSSSSPFSSVSPRGQHGLFNTPPPAERYISKLQEDGEFGANSDFPIVLDSDDEEAIIIASQQSQQSFSFYEAPTEEEQYQWAMEESIRASQMTASQNSVADHRLKDEEDDFESISSQVFDEDNPFAHPDFASRITRSKSGSQGASAHSSKISTPKLSPKVELPNRRDTFVVHEDKEKGRDEDDKKGKDGSGDGGDEDNDDENDEQMKAVLLASLTEKDIQEQEEKEVEEAIRLSLLDQEENKENISPDKSAGQKKMMEKKKMAGDSKSTHLQGRDGQQDARSTPSVICLDDEEDRTTPSRRVTRGSKGKDREPSSSSSSQKQAEEDQSLGLFRLEAVVSHTGLSMSSSTPTSVATGGQRGRYVCDRLGTDGIWRSHDGSKTSKLGSISDLTRFRSRSGYLFFYVRCHPGAGIS